MGNLYSRSWILYPRCGLEPGLAAPQHRCYTINYATAVGVTWTRYATTPMLYHLRHCSRRNLDSLRHNTDALPFTPLPRTSDSWVSGFTQPVVELVE